MGLLDYFQDLPQGSYLLGIQGLLLTLSRNRLYRLRLPVRSRMFLFQREINPLLPQG